MVASTGKMVGEGVMGNSAVIVTRPRPAAILIYLAKRKGAWQLVVVFASQHAGLAAGAARAVKMKSVLHNVPFPPSRSLQTTRHPATMEGGTGRSRLL